MAAAAVGSAETYAKEIDGIFYYTPGDSDSIKAAANAAAMWDARTAANTRAREILSDILRLEKLTPAQKTSVTAQLEKISKSDTLGNVSYNAVLLLGNAADSKSAAAFLRYFDVPANLVRFWGTAQWDNSDILTDFSMRGARFATMPAMSPDFVKLYDAANGAAPGRMAGFGFDAAAVAFGMITSPKSASGYLLNPGGFVGLDGIFRFRPNGTSGRAMEIVELNGTDTPKVVRAANTDFISAAGDTNPTNARRPAAMNLKTDGINPLDYIKLPDTLRGKYKSKTFGNTSSVIHHPSSIDESVEILPEDDSDVIIDPTFTPFAPATVSRKPIDEVKILNQ